MTSEEDSIMLTLLFESKEYQIQTNKNQYHSLMVLIADHLSIPDFGLCAGMGSCGTCKVKIGKKDSPIVQYELSCQVQINEELTNTCICIEPNNY